MKLILHLRAAKREWLVTLMVPVSATVHRLSQEASQLHAVID